MVVVVSLGGGIAPGGVVVVLGHAGGWSCFEVVVVLWHAEVKELDYALASRSGGEIVVPERMDAVYGVLVAGVSVDALEGLVRAEIMESVCLVSWACKTA